MSLEQCPSCGWPTGPGCEVCNQAAIDTSAFPEHIQEKVRELEEMGHELKAAYQSSVLYRRAMELWGEEAQLAMLQEEAAEVIVAVSHLLRSAGDGASGPPTVVMELAEELADLEIMIEQTRAMGFGTHINYFKREKLARLKRRVEEAEGMR